MSQLAFTCWIGSGLRAPFTSGAVGRRLPSQRVTIAAPGSSAYL